MIRRPPRSTLDRSSAASDVYKRQEEYIVGDAVEPAEGDRPDDDLQGDGPLGQKLLPAQQADAVSYTHLRAHETVLDLVCRLLLAKKKHDRTTTITTRLRAIHESHTE